MLGLVTGASHKYTAASACELQLALSELSAPDRSDEHTVIYLAPQHGWATSRKGVWVKSMLCPYLTQYDSISAPQNLYFVRRIPTGLSKMISDEGQNKHQIHAWKNMGTMKIQRKDATNSNIFNMI